MFCGARYRNTKKLHIMDAKRACSERRLYIMIHLGGGICRWLFFVRRYLYIYYVHSTLVWYNTSIMYAAQTPPPRTLWAPRPYGDRSVWRILGDNALYTYMLCIYFTVIYTSCSCIDSGSKTQYPLLNPAQVHGPRVGVYTLRRYLPLHTLGRTDSLYVYTVCVLNTMVENKA